MRLMNPMSQPRFVSVGLSPSLSPSLFRVVAPYPYPYPCLYPSPYPFLCRGLFPALDSDSDFDSGRPYAHGSEAEYPTTSRCQ